MCTKGMSVAVESEEGVGSPGSAVRDGGCNMGVLGSELRFSGRAAFLSNSKRVS